MEGFQTLKEIKLGREDYRLYVLKEVNASVYVTVIYKYDRKDAEGREIFRSYPYTQADLAEQAAKEYYLHLNKPPVI